MSENLNTQSRKWMITTNNPQTCGLDHNHILELLQLFRPDYFCRADEIAGTGTIIHTFFCTHILRCGLELSNAGFLPPISTRPMGQPRKIEIISAKRASGRRLQKPRQEWMEVL